LGITYCRSKRIYNAHALGTRPIVRQACKKTRYRKKNKNKEIIKNRDFLQFKEPF
jgi:hypothetical protein